MNHEIQDASKKILHEAKMDEPARLLMTVPGIGYYSALLIASEIDDVNRFPDSSHVCSYTGLTPSTHSSGAVSYHGRITRTGSGYLRWALIECVQTHIRTQPESTITQFYNRLAKKKDASKAKVAAASKLLKVVYWVLKERRPHHG